METRINGTKCKKLYFKKSGKNLLDAAALVTGSLNALAISDNGYTIELSGTSAYAQTKRMNLPINIIKGKTLYISVDSAEGNGLGYLYVDYESPTLGTIRINTDRYVTSVSLDIPEDVTTCQYLFMVNGTTTSATELSNVIKGARITLNESDAWEPYEPFVLYKKAYAKKSDKNLLKNTAVSKTINGVEFTVNGDGSVTVNGTAIADTIFFVTGTANVKAGIQYKLSGCPIVGDATTFAVDVRDLDLVAVYGRDIGYGEDWTPDKDEEVAVMIRVASGATVSNLTFYPMLRRADISDPTYEPYEEWTLIYSAGNPVTYVVDTDTTYTEDVDFDASCLSPKTFTPSKDGYTFHGWRKDTTASADVETNLVMGDEPMTLYAVFGKDVTLTYAGNGATSGSTAPDTEKAYYNNGSETPATFKLKANGFTRKGYTFSKWNIGAVGANVELTENTTATAQWTDNAYYAIQSGSRVNCPNATCGAGGSLLVETGTISTPYGNIYGARSSHGGSGTNTGTWYARTGTLQTKGCKYLTIGAYMDLTQYTHDSGHLVVYGNGAVIKEESLANTSYLTSRTIDVSAYSTIEVYVYGRGWEELIHTVGLQTVRLYN